MHVLVYFSILYLCVWKIRTIRHLLNAFFNLKEILTSFSQSNILIPLKIQEVECRTTYQKSFYTYATDPFKICRESDKRVDREPCQPTLTRHYQFDYKFHNQ